MLLFINILKIAVSAIGRLLCHHLPDFSVCYNFVLQFYFITQQYLLMWVQNLVLSSRSRVLSLRY